MRRAEHGVPAMIIFIRAAGVKNDDFRCFRVAASNASCRAPTTRSKGDVLAICCAPRAKVPARRAKRARGRWARPGSVRSVVCGIKCARFFGALFMNDADERHAHHLLSYRLSGAARGRIAGELRAGTR